MRAARGRCRRCRSIIRSGLARRPNGARRESHRLPEKYRRPLILCYLEGKTSEAAAEELGCPRGTIASRLSRGHSNCGTARAAWWVRQRPNTYTHALDVPATVTRRASEIVLTQVGNTGTAGTLATPAAVLAEGVLKAMLVTKLKTVVILLAALCLLGSGAGLLAWGVAAKQDPAAKAAPPPSSAEKNAQKDAAQRRRPTLPQPRLQSNRPGWKWPKG